MNLFLIGLPGSGKSTLARELASKLFLKLIDTDAEIILSEGKSIETIFKEDGEEYFRAKEKELLHKLALEKDVVISTGGGTPCFFDNMEYINNHGISIFIDVPVETIHQRLIGQRIHNRPMLLDKTDEEVLVFLKQKYEERIPFYSKAIIHIKGSNIKTNEILEELRIKKIV